MIKSLFISFWLCCLCSAPLLAQEDSTTIAILGCHNQHEITPVIPYFADLVKPQYSVWVGDNVYADTKTDAQNIKKQLDILAQKDGFNRLRTESKFMVTWDDHDFGYNNAGINYVYKNESLQIHRKFWRLENDVPVDQDGIYYAKIELLPNGKKLQFIMVDIRFNKENPGIGSDILGDKQWLWLQKQLKVEADLRLIVSGTQVLLNRPSRWEAWTKHGTSKKKLFDLIKTENANGVVFITGDQHYVEVLKQKKKLGYAAYEIMAAGINKTEKPGRSNNRVAGPDLTIHSAPLLVIHWEERNGRLPHLHFTVTNVENGNITLSYRILLSEIGLVYQ